MPKSGRLDFSLEDFVAAGDVQRVELGAGEDDIGEPGKFREIWPEEQAGTVFGDHELYRSLERP